MINYNRQKPNRREDHNEDPIVVFAHGNSWPHNEKYKKFLFPSGELGIEFEEKMLINRTDEIIIDARITNAEEIIELMLVTNYIKHSSPDAELILFIPYIPFGRQDRHTTKTSPWSLKVIADMINSCGFDKVVTVTPHSNVTDLLINNLEIHEFYDDAAGDKKGNFERMIILTKGQSKPPVLIAPDSGAEKRTYEIAKHFGIEEVYVATKRRNPVTGEIYGYSVPSDIPEERDLVVIDDICDGGRTFIELAKKLPTKRKSLKLFVTHGIFSKGRQVLLDAGYDEVQAGFNFIEQRYFDGNDGIGDLY